MSQKVLSEGQIKYLQEVLGIQNLMLPQDGRPVLTHELNQSPNVQGEVSSARLIAIFPLSPEHFPLKPEARDLAEKMIRAMKIESDQVFWFEYLVSQSQSIESVAEILKDVGHRPVLVFHEDAIAASLGIKAEVGQWTVDHASGARILFTYSIQSLLENPLLKKTAWAHLQKVMKEI